jgi:hypothetical protein
MQHSDFYQQKLFEKRWYSFTDEGLHIKYKKVLKTHEYELKYEDIGTRIIQSKTGVRQWLIATIIFTIISLTLLIDRATGGDVERGAELIYIFLALMCGAGYYFTYKKSCFLAIELLINNPSKHQFEDFLTEIKSRRRDSLLERYGQLNKNLSYEYQHSNLTWLLDNEVLSKQEFNERLTQLNNLQPSATTVTGFTFGKN